jgi:hypothetical protein
MMKSGAPMTGKVKRFSKSGGIGIAAKSGAEQIRSLSGRTKRGVDDVTKETLNKSLASVASAGLGDLKPQNSST